MKISLLPPHFHLFTIYKLHLKLPNSAEPSTHSATRPAAQMSLSEFMAEAAGGVTGHETHNAPFPDPLSVAWRGRPSSGESFIC